MSPPTTHLLKGGMYILCLSSLIPLQWVLIGPKYMPLSGVVTALACITLGCLFHLSAHLSAYVQTAKDLYHPTLLADWESRYPRNRRHLQDLSRGIWVGGWTGSVLLGLYVLADSLLQPGSPQIVQALLPLTAAVILQAGVIHPLQSSLESHALQQGLTPQAKG